MYVSRIVAVLGVAFALTACERSESKWNPDVMEYKVPTEDSIESKYPASGPQITGAIVSSVHHNGRDDTSTAPEFFSAASVKECFQTGKNFTADKKNVLWWRPLGWSSDLSTDIRCIGNDRKVVAAFACNLSGVFYKVERGHSSIPLVRDAKSTVWEKKYTISCEEVPAQHLGVPFL
jgi:hypothetical protein